MPPHVLWIGFGLFGGALSLHLLLWRAVRVRREMGVLGLCFLFPPLLALPALVCACGIPPDEAVAAAWLALCLGASYMLSYPALKVDPPTLRIMCLLDRQGRGGLTESEIVEVLKDWRHLSSYKAEELRGDALVREGDGRLVLTWAGSMLARGFSLYRRWLGLPPGAG